LYARFWHKVLHDLGHVSTPEPFQKLVNQGLILNAGQVRVLADEAADGAGGDWRARRQVESRLLAHPLTLHGATYASAAAYAAVGRAAATPAWLAAALPPGVLLHSILSRDAWYPPAPGGGAAAPVAEAAAEAATLGLRLQQLPYAPPVAFALESLFTPGSLAAANETTIDLTEGKERGLTMAQIAARAEVRGLVSSLRLPHLGRALAAG
jgi:hypothetical protein